MIAHQGHGRIHALVWNAICSLHTIHKPGCMVRAAESKGNIDDSDSKPDGRSKAIHH